MKTFYIPENKFDDTAQVESMVNEILTQFAKKPCAFCVGYRF